MTDDIAGEQAAGRPGGNAGRAWVRVSFPEGDDPKGSNPLRSSAGFKPRRGRAVQVTELPEGGCLILNEDGTHRTVPRLSPPEGEGWVALHDESGLPDSALAQNRWSSKQNRKIKAEREIAQRIDALEAPLPEGQPTEPGKELAREGGEGAIDPLSLSGKQLMGDV